MRYLKNYDQLATTSKRRLILQLIESAIESIQPEKVFKDNFTLVKNILKIKDKQFDLASFNRIFLLGFGKGSAKMCSLIESLIKEFLTYGYVIDISSEKFEKVEFTKGTHPLPSIVNLNFTQKVLKNLSGLGNDDLVVIVTFGGGSALFEKPHRLALDDLVKIEKALLTSGADIYEFNTVRKHLSNVKGGGLSKVLYPARVVNLIFSDVPGNDLSVVASGPAVCDKTTADDAYQIYSKYQVNKILHLDRNDFNQTPKDQKYFAKVANMLILSNLTALNAMQASAQKLHQKAIILTDSFKDEAKLAGQKLIEQTPPKTILLAGGETTVHVTGSGKGGRNQELVLAALPHINQNTLIASFGSDGWDNSDHAGALADVETIKRAKKLNLLPQEYLQKNNSYAFFDAIGSAILTGRLPSNVSDLMIISKQ